MSVLGDLGGTAGVIDALLAGRDLTIEEARAVMDHVFEGEAEPAVIAGLLIAWRSKGESGDEITGMVRSMLQHAILVDLDAPAMDIVGTGGDYKNSVNISTMAALAVAGAGVHVCKHGNRAASSSVGTADVLEELGVTLEARPETVAHSVATAGIGFCFAPAFHPAMRFVAPIRRALGVRTAFNFIGPLANPSRPKRMLVGTADPASQERMAMVLGANGIERAWVIHSEDGYDEISLAAPTRVVEVLGDGAGNYELSAWSFDPKTVPLGSASEKDIRGGDVAYNASVVRSFLNGTQGPVRDLVSLNAAAALVIAGTASTLEDGILAVQASIDEGRAAAALAGLVAASAQGRE